MQAVAGNAGTERSNPVRDGQMRRRLPRARLLQGAAVRKRGWPRLFLPRRSGNRDAYVLFDAGQGGMCIVGEGPESEIGVGRHAAFRIGGEGLRAHDVAGRVVWMRRSTGSRVLMGIAFKEKEIGVAARLALWNLARAARKGMADRARCGESGSGVISVHETGWRVK